jgi:N-acetylneuraminate synthase
MTISIANNTPRVDRDMNETALFIIAEAGINHNGDINIAKKLIDMAKETGCNAIKFQKRTVDVVYSPEVLATPRESPWGTTTRQQKLGLEFGEKEYDEIDRYCKEVEIDWFASVWDIPSQEFLRQYDLPYNKIPSAMLTNLELVRFVAQERKETFISTGMSTLDDVDRAVEIFRKADCPFVLLHSVSVYPCRDDECNISMVKTLKERYKCTVGYSGHEVGVLPSVLAVAQGAEVIERHITLDRAMYGSDQPASLERRGLEILVRDCRLVRAVLGNGNKTFSEAEKAVAKKLRYFMGNI